MEITIKESLTNLKELQKDYQQFHDDVWQDPESYGTIAESLKVAISTMSKYEKIEKIVKNRGGKSSLATLVRIVRVVEDGNNNRNVI